MPRINGINFYQNRSKIKSFLPKKKVFFECWWIRPQHPMPPVAGGLAPRPHLPPLVGGSAPRPRNTSPHRRFLATRVHEEKFSAGYCRPPFVLAFAFKCTWNVWRRRCSHSQTVYNTAESISPGNTYTEKLSQKSFYLHQSHFGFGRDEFFLSEHCTLF